MSWLDYLTCFGAGLFLANAVPHFVYGVCGDCFPTPFALPPGKGLSSATLNVVWALFNMLIGAVLFRVGGIANGGDIALIVFFAGFALISVLSSVIFSKKQAGP